MNTRDLLDQVNLIFDVEAVTRCRDTPSVVHNAHVESQAFENFGHSVVINLDAE